MTSPRRIEANRQNAQRSTGPRSRRGKARASKNAAKHGLSENQIVLTGPERARLQRRRKQWAADLQPRDAVERELFETLLHATIVRERVDRLDAVAWDDARRLAAEAFDRDHPGPLDADAQARRQAAITAALPEPRALRTFLRHAPRWDRASFRALHTLRQLREQRHRPRSQNEARESGSEIERFQEVRSGLAS